VSKLFWATAGLNRSFRVSSALTLSTLSLFSSLDSSDGGVALGEPLGGSLVLLNLG
jgi:hypothetical protein